MTPRFLVFGGQSVYERAGGMEDMLREFNASEYARVWAEGYSTGAGSLSWAYVWDVCMNRKIHEFKNGKAF